jgi:hypothetical protein
MTRPATLVLALALSVAVGCEKKPAPAEEPDGQKPVQKTFAGPGANNLLVFPGNSMMGGVSSGQGTTPTLTPEDRAALEDADRCPAVAAVAPIVRARTQVVSKDKNWSPTYLYGTTPNFLDIRDWTVEKPGRNFSDEDVARMSDVCLLGQTVARELFGQESPLGQQVRINNRPIAVVGVLSPKGANTFGLDQDDIVLLPWKTLKYKVVGQSVTPNAVPAARWWRRRAASPAGPWPNGINLYPPTPDGRSGDVARFTNIDMLYIKARSREDVRAAIQQVREVLRERHKLKPGQEDDFQIRDLGEAERAPKGPGK